MPKSGEHLLDKPAPTLSNILSGIACAVIAGTVGFNILFDQNVDSASTAKRVVNVQADRLEPLLNILAEEAPPSRSGTTHMSVQESIADLIEDTPAASPPGSDIATLQDDLRLQGMYSGPQTGTLDPETRQAIRNYQASRGMPVTGEPSQQLAEALLFDRKISSAANFTASSSPVLGHEDIRNLQAALRDYGFDPGPIDGNLGLRTTAAIRQFQSRIGVEPTGLITPQLQTALGLSPTQARNAGALQ